MVFSGNQQEVSDKMLKSLKDKLTKSKKTVTTDFKVINDLD